MSSLSLNQNSLRTKKNSRPIILMKKITDRLSEIMRKILKLNYLSQNQTTNEL